MIFGVGVGPTTAPIVLFDWSGSQGAGVQNALAAQLTEAIGVALPYAAGLLALSVGFILVKWLVLDSWLENRALEAGVSTFERATVASLGDMEDEDDPNPVADGMVDAWNDEHYSDPTDDDDEDGGGNDPHDDVGDVLDDDDD